MADKDEDGFYRSHDGQKHETHFQANERNKAHGEEMRQTYPKPLDNAFVVQLPAKILF